VSWGAEASTYAFAIEFGPFQIVMLIVIAVLSLLWIKQLSDKQAEDSGMRGTVLVDLVNPRSGEHKYVKVGFSWMLFWFSGILGIPLFLRRLYMWGAVFLVLWILYILIPQILPDTTQSAGTYLLLCLVFLSLQIWIAVKGNEMTAKNLLENGWRFSSPNTPETRFAMTKWNLSVRFAPENSKNEVLGDEYSQFPAPRTRTYVPTASATTTPISTVRSVVEPNSVTARTSALNEFSSRILETKFDIYLRLCRAAGILGVFPADSGAYVTAKKELIAIYAGEFQLVASPEVSSAFAAFVDHLETANTEQLGALKSEAQKLAFVCRQDTGA
jgi:hypothetical protein